MTVCKDAGLENVECVPYVIANTSLVVSLVLFLPVLCGE